jgi:membrane protein YdbS with pleckstrin-like domain
MKFKSSIVSQLFEIILILLINIILFILLFAYNTNLTKISFASIFWYILLIIEFFVIDEIIIRNIYTYEISESGVKESFVLFSKKETFIPYTSIMKLELKKSFFGRIFKYGDIEISSTASSKIVMKGVKNPEKIFMKIKEKFEIYKKEKEKNE